MAELVHSCDSGCTVQTSLRDGPHSDIRHLFALCHGWRKACHSKGKFYGALKHNCGTPNGEVSCGYVSKDLATEHKFRIVDKDSVEGKKLAGVEQTLYGFQKTQRLGRSEATSALNEVVNMCLASTQTKTQSMCQRSRTSLSMTAYKVQGATILGSKPTCKAPANVEVVWPNIIHGFCASQRVDPATLLRGLTPEALKEYAPEGCASVLVKQACQDPQAPAAEALMPLPLVSLSIELLETSLEHLCRAALGSPGMGYISALLDAVPDVCASSADTKQPLMKAVAACIQLVDHVTDRRTTLMLEAAWKAVIAAFNPRSMVQLIQDMTRDFWGYSDARSVLSAFDVSIVQSALPSLEDHNKMLASKETMSAALLTFMSAMPAMSYSSSLEIEPDAGLADPPHTADAMAEGDSADAVAKVALAAAQAEAVVNTQLLPGPSKLNSGRQGDAWWTYRAAAPSLQRLCKLRPNSSDAKPLGPLESKLSEAEEETQASHAAQAAQSAEGAKAAQAAQGAEGAKAAQAIKPSQSSEKGDTGKGGLRLLPRTVTETKEAKAAETPDTALQHEMQSAGRITSAADALNKRNQSSQPDGGKPRGESRHCQQAECSSPAGTEVQGLEMSAVKKASDGLHDDQEPMQHPEVHAKWLVQAELASSSTLRTQDISAGSELVQQEILPEAGKQALRVASLVLEKAYANGYKDAKHEVAEHCMKTSG
ncbi:hypothetical protein WJX82_001509 [Trebouxia sp. C0006]